jgi:branched-chain amino acid aminotransferase
MPIKEWTVYINGEFLPESQARLSVHDQGFLHGDAVFDASRTFNGKVFRLKDHLDRLYRSCQYMQLDPGVSKEEMERLSLEVVERNLPLLQKNEDMWVSQRVTRGVSSPYPGEKESHTLIIECRVIPFAKRARYYVDGISLITPAVRRVPPWAVSPRAKTHNYINMVLGDLEARAQNPSAWALLLDERGNLAEGRGSNIFLVRDGTLFTPKEQFVLAGITRQVAMELADNLDVPVHEADLDLYDAYTADEAFLTSTSLCVCPVSSINGYKIGDGKVPGKLTSRLMSAFSDLVGMDYVAQYLHHLREGETRPF